MNAPPTARQRLLQYFDQYDRERPGDFTVAGAAIEALEGLDVHTALQELRSLGRAGQLELVGAPIGVVHGLTYVRLTNKGRKAGGECHGPGRADQHPALYRHARGRAAHTHRLRSAGAEAQRDGGLPRDYLARRVRPD